MPRLIRIKPEHNGRVDIMESSNLTQYDLFKDKNQRSDLESFRKEATKTILLQTKLSQAFFSDINIDALQQGIKTLVYKKTGNVIPRQSDLELMIIMRAFYLQYSLNLPYNIIEQVRSLNKQVLDFAVPRIVREIEQYKLYRKEVSTLPIPIDRPVNMSSAGTKVLEIKDL